MEIPQLEELLYEDKDKHRKWHCHDSKSSRQQKTDSISPTKRISTNLDALVDPKTIPTHIVSWAKRIINVNWIDAAKSTVWQITIGRR
jgi:hypothetical protein